MLIYPDMPTLGWLMPRDVHWLIARGVPMAVIVRPEPMRLAYGYKAHDGRFDYDPSGPVWFAFIEPEDIVFWEPRTGALATWNGRSFALGESMIDNASTYSFDFALNVFASPLDWLRAGRDGIVVVNWERRVFDHLRDCPRVAVAERLLPLYERQMQPARMPDLFVLPEPGELSA
ncbi:hypothetical protein ACCS88_21315 [Rhizobium ruizarguesonis]